MKPNPLKQLSPLRNSSQADTVEQLAREQAQHFGINCDSDYGKSLVRLASQLYESNLALHDLWKITLAGLGELDKKDRIAWFNAKRFLSFQLAKLLDNLQNPTRATYQSIVTHHSGNSVKGAYPIFDNVAAIFSASPVITRTATYLFACTEWVEDAFAGREPLHNIYSRLLNPTSISLANHIVDIECGEESNEYLAWNFNSGMAAIDGVMSHLLGYQDIVLSSRNIYGGTYQLLNDWYAKKSNLDVALEWVDDFDGDGFARAMDSLAEKYTDRLNEGRKIYIFLESPCNPHGYVLDVPAICRAAHERGWRVVADTTVGTPFLNPVMRRPESIERPDFVVHSYTKDLAGNGTTTAGVVIGRNADMFIPKGEKVECNNPDGSPRSVDWSDTLFWNVYYIKGAFLDSDKAFEVLNGMKTFEMRVLQKTINTTVLARVLNEHPDINVSCPALPGNANHALLQKNMHLGLPAPLFTIDVEGKNGRDAVPQAAYKRFLDMLEPAVGMQVSLGQTNTVALCPAMTTHSELSLTALTEAGITPTTTRIAVGLEDPRIFLSHLQRAAEIALDPVINGFSQGFPSGPEIDNILIETSKEIQARHLSSLPTYETLMS